MAELLGETVKIVYDLLGVGSLLRLSAPAERHHRKPGAENHVINQELNKTGDDIQHNGKTVFCDGRSFVSFLPFDTIQARHVRKSVKLNIVGVFYQMRAS